MRIKKTSIIFGTIIIVLLILITLLVRNILNIGTKEVKVAKDFIYDLYESRIIEESKELKNDVIKEESLNKASNNNSKIKYSVIVGKYAVDIDKDYNILGFSNKSVQEVISRTSEISEDEAINLASSYLSKITNEEIKFKEIRYQEGVETPVYNVIFYKYKNGYPYYSQEISTLINKKTGKLEGYGNYPINEVKYIDEINIKEEAAATIVKDNFKNLNLDITLIEKPILQYVDVSDKEMVLAYIFNIVVNKDSDENKNNSCVSLVRADTGEIINYGIEAAVIK